MDKNTDREINIKLLSFDIDNTLIDFDTFKSNFGKIWNQYKSQTNALLAFNTGRLKEDVLSLIEKGVLPKPDYIISGVGTHIYDYKNKKLVKEFNDVLDEGWDLEAVEKSLQI